MTSKEAERNARIDISNNDEIEIDDELTEKDFSHGEDGCWVRAWLWVEDENKS